MDKGHEVVLWTSRAGDELNNAIDWCEDRGLHFCAINDNAPSNVRMYQKTYPQGNRKIFADIYIDDHNLEYVSEPNVAEKYLIQYEKRIWTMYGLWSAVYFIHVCYNWIVNGELGVLTFLKYLYGAVVHTSYATIWFLPALGVGVAITYLLVEKLNKKAIYPIAVALYVIGMFGYTYSFVVEGTVIGTVYDVYETFMYTARNGIFNGTPFIFMGYLIAKKDIKASVKGFFRYAIPAGISLVLIIVEAFILKLKFNVTGMDISIFLPPFIYFFIMAVMHIDLKENKAWIWCRKLSLLIFVTQRLFLTMLPAFFPTVFEKLYSNSYIGLIAVLGITIAFSVVFILLSDKIKFLKKMI
jgi:hypothetical protein